MKEQVFLGANVNESETFVSKSFNRAFSHSYILKVLSSIRLNRIIQPEPLHGHYNSKIEKVEYSGDLQDIFATRTELLDRRTQSSRVPQCFEAVQNQVEPKFASRADRRDGRRLLLARGREGADIRQLESVEGRPSRPRHTPPV